MIGTNATTGKALSGIELCEQNIRDILTTRKGTRVMRRDYGSDLMALVDSPSNQDTRMRMIVATVDAIDLWEPDVQVKTVNFTVTTDGVWTCSLTGDYLPDGVAIKINGIQIN